MSYTSLYAIKDDGSAEEVATFGNAFRGGFLVWDTLSKRYLGRGFGFGDAHGRETWGLARRDDVRWEDRVVMAATFDRVLVRREHWPELIRCFRCYAERSEDPGHIGAQADAIEALPRGVQAVGWNQTSVSESYFATRVREGENEDGTFWEREEPFDLATSERHWFLFDELKRPARTEVEATR